MIQSADEPAHSIIDDVSRSNKPVEPFFASSSSVDEVVIRYLTKMILWGIGIAFLAWVFGIFRRPLRERHEVEFLIGLIENALKNGRNVERDIVSLADGRDESLGSRFFLLAEWLRKGRMFPDALDKVGGLVPPGIHDMLNYGFQKGCSIVCCRCVISDCATRMRGSTPRCG